MLLSVIVHVNNNRFKRVLFQDLTIFIENGSIAIANTVRTN